MPFYCAICGEESTRICVRCTKDTCANHLCERCAKCSDCCECEVPLEEPAYIPPPMHGAHIPQHPEAPPEPEAPAPGEPGLP